MPVDLDPLLSLNLWDLRAQAESQLRCLVLVHRLIDELPALAQAERAEQKVKIINGLTSVLEIDAGIRVATHLALEQVEQMGRGVAR